MKFICLFIPVLLFSTSVAADGDAWIKQTAYGMDCAPCAYAIERGIGKMPGVGEVKVTLSAGLVEVFLLDEAEPDVAGIRETILHGGFTPKDAEVRLSGILMQDGEDYRLSVGERGFVLSSTENVSAELMSQRAGENVVITGQVPEGASDRIAVDALILGTDS